MTSTAITDPRAGSGRPRSSGSLPGPLSDTWAMIRRNLIHISRAPLQLIKSSAAPVFAIYGERDHTMSVADVTRVRGLLEEARRTYRMSIVKDMPHGWLNETMPGRYYQNVAEATWTELLSFLNEVDPSSPTPPPAGPGQITWEFRPTISTDYDFSQNERHE